MKEGDSPGKGANTTLSLLNHYLDHFADPDKDHVLICCDNCTGQAHNNAAIHLMLWKVMRGDKKWMSVSCDKDPFN